MIWAGVVAILIMAALGAPLFAVLLAASMLGFYSADIDLAIVAIELYRIVDTPLLVALPLFTFSGYLLSEANTSTRLVNLMQSVFGFLPSGLAIVAFVACAVFTALTGASGVTIVALGALLFARVAAGGICREIFSGSGHYLRQLRPVIGALGAVNSLWRDRPTAGSRRAIRHSRFVCCRRGADVIDAGHALRLDAMAASGWHDPARAV